MRNLFDAANHQWLTLRAAVRRTDSDLRSIRRWKAAGMPTVILEGKVYVPLDVLLGRWRKNLLNHPCLQRHWARIRRLELKQQHVVQAV